MDTKNTKLQRIIDILKEKGQTNEQITQLMEELTKTSFARMYSEVMASFDEEDLASVEACKDQEEANGKIKQLYNLRTGKNADEEAQKFIDTFCQGFLAEYEKEKSQASA